MSALIGSIVAFILGGLAILGFVPHQQIQPVSQLPPQTVQQNTNMVSTHTGPTATIDQSSLFSSSANPTITGTATNVSSIGVRIYQDIPKGSSNGMSTPYSVFGIFPVKNGSWSVTISPSTFNTSEWPGNFIGEGTYVVYITTADGGTSLADGTLTIKSNQISVPGMSKYTDPDFGFSFWYPSDWKISSATASNPAVIGGGTITKVLNISASTPFLSFSIDEFDSPNRRLEYPGGACGYCAPVTWYFDVNQHVWMHQYPMGVGGMPDATQSEFDQTKGATLADISRNTIGGLHIFPSEQKENVSIVPLSAHHFLIVNHNEGYENPGSNKELPLVKTIVATDPAVATPVSADEQIKTIQAEKDAYAGQ